MEQFVNQDEVVAIMSQKSARPRGEVQLDRQQLTVTPGMRVSTHRCTQVPTHEHTNTNAHTPHTPIK